jgi:hypothetical protein
VGCSSQGGSAGAWGCVSDGEAGLLVVVVLRRRVVGTGCWWGQSHCQRQLWLAEGKAIQDLHGSSQIIRAGGSARARGTGSYEGPHMNQA